jgi:hypothetical protein
MKKLLPFLFVLFVVLVAILAFPPSSRTFSTYPAASCATSDIQSAINAEAASPVSGDIITVPSCTQTFTTVPTTITTAVNLTIQGQTAISTNCATPPTFNTACTATDNTKLTDGRTSTNLPAFFLINMTGSASQVVRVSGFSFTLSSSAFGNDGEVQVNTNTAGQQVRVDHNDFVIGSASQSAFVFIFGSYGVADHNIFNAGTTLTNAVSVNSGGDGSIPWNTNTPRGTANNFFLENNTFLGGYADDCKKGGTFVSRYNYLIAPSTSNNSAVGQSHATGSDYVPGDNPQPQGRGCRSWEIYGNYVTGAISGGVDFASFDTSGTGVQWGNTETNYQSAMQLVDDRDNNSTYTSIATPTGYGYCGSSFSGTGSAWDGNNPSAVFGYPCLDQIGRGKGDLLTGQFPNVLDSVTSTITWPNQALEPVYLFMENWTPVPSSGRPEIGFGNNANGNIALNRDAYGPNSACAPNGCSSLTTGTGYGTLAQRPATCSAGPSVLIPSGGNLPGVGYWATDTQTLYSCYPANTWNTWYTPYTYPHPLVSGPPVIALTPSCTPTSGVVPQTVTCTNPNAGTTVMCYSASPTSPVTNGLGTACSTGTKYTTAITVSSAETLEIVAGTSTLSDSPAASYTYTAAPVAPTVTTTTATSITATGAIAGGTVTATGGASVTSEGTCYGTSPNPTTPCTSDGTATPFTSTLSSLTPNTTYFYRAFATNSAGTSYGADLSFSTPSSCAVPITIGPYTSCNTGYADVNSSTTATVNMSPFAGNDVTIISHYCANSSCNTAPTQTATISDNINSPETCFTQPTGSPFAFDNTSVPDHERIYVWHCHGIPSGVTNFTVTTSGTVSFLQLIPHEWQAGTIAASGYFDTGANEANAGATAGTTATVSTSVATSHANDLIFAMLVSCGASIPATVGTGYTGLVVNPTSTPGLVTEAMAVNATGTQTATTTWSSGSAPSSCALGAGGSNDTWFGVIVPLVGAASSSPGPARVQGGNTGKTGLTVH